MDGARSVQNSTRVVGMGELCSKRQTPHRSTNSALRIASFNVQIFGRKKVADARVFDILVQIVKRYDIILIQEIRDKSGKSIKALVEAVNRDSKSGRYEHATSARLGRSKAKEQYSFIYKTDAVTLEDVYQYDDTAKDHFEREPFCAKFSCSKAAISELVFIAIHVDPDTVEEELHALVDVHQAVARRWNTDNILIMGDFNADSRYISSENLDGLQLRTDTDTFTWLISDEVDTTTTDSDYTYDRFVVSGEQLKRSIVPNSAVVFRYDVEYLLSEQLTERVSDHYPIELLIKSAK